MTIPAQIQRNRAQIARINFILRGGLDHPLVQWVNRVFWYLGR